MAEEIKRDDAINIVRMTSKVTMAYSEHAKDSLMGPHPAQILICKVKEEVR